MSGNEAFDVNKILDEIQNGVLEPQKPLVPAPETTEYIDGIPVIDAVEPWAVDNIFQYVKVFHDVQASRLYVRNRLADGQQYLFKGSKTLLTRDKILSLGHTIAGSTEQFESLRQQYYQYAVTVTPKNKKGQIIIKDFWKYLCEQYFYWLADSRSALSVEPAYCSWDPEEPTFLYVNSQRIVPGPVPAWESFESQMPSEMVPVWRAWIFSLFKPDNTSRQIMWLHSQDGFAGMTRVLNAIHESFPESTAALSDKSRDSEFFGSTLFGKRIGLADDIKNPRFLDTQEIHSLSGGGITVINSKNEAMFPARLYMKILVASNVAPEIENWKRHVTSRLIYIPLQALTSGSHIKDGVPVGDPTFPGRLKAQIWNYLFYCQESYIKLCPTDSNITCPSNTWEDIASGQQLDFQSWIEDNYTITKSYHDTIPAKVLWDKFRNDFPEYPRTKYRELEAFLKPKKICKERSSEGEFWHGLTAKTLFSLGKKI